MLQELAPYILSLLGLGLLIYGSVPGVRAVPLPPGPTPRFLSGNAHQLPHKHNWRQFARWAEYFDSPIISFRVFKRTYIVLNDLKSVNDLLEAKAKIYSSRPWAEFYHGLMKRGLSVFNISSQHPWFKAERRLLQGNLNPRATREYRQVQEDAMRVLIHRVYETPNDFIAHFRHNAAAIILKIAYGWTIAPNNDRFVAGIEEGFKIGSQASRPGIPVDAIPMLRYIPSWFPGAGFKRQARAWAVKMAELDTLPHDWAKEQIASGDFVPSFTSRHLLPEDGHAINTEEEQIIKWCSHALYAGGADTTVSTISSFVLHMALRPDIQRKAQEEVDRILEKTRLPTVDDIPSLTYVSAVLKEVLRFTPVAPIGLPHSVTEDDEYLGYRIPAGSTVIANIWAITRDTKVYPDASSFNPERFLGENTQLDPRKIVFGFGRRVCPGAHFAEISLLLNMAALLACFDIRKPLDKLGQEYTPEVEYTSGITSHPEPFQCRITPRAHATSWIARPCEGQ